MDTVLRNYITPVAVAVFAALAISGLMLAFGIRTHALGEVHEWLGYAFVVVGILHVVRNRRAFAHTMGQSRAQAIVVVLCALFLLILAAAYISGPGPGGGPHRGRGHHGGPQFSQTVPDAPATLR